jgi:hypothetical protein
VLLQFIAGHSVELTEHSRCEVDVDPLRARRLLAAVQHKCYTLERSLKMPTKSPRISVALEKSVYSLIEKIAKENGLSLSMVTRDLIREALMVHEDAELVRFGEEREGTLRGREPLRHEEVWK